MAAVSDSPEEALDERPISEVLFTYAKAIVAALLIAWFVRTFVVEAYRIPNSGMSPALVPGDTAFVTKFDYSIRLPGIEGALFLERLPQRGDLVVFITQGRNPRETLKRVIAIQDDRIAVKNGVILLNDKPTSTIEQGKCGTETLEVSEGSQASFTVCRESPLLPDREPVVLAAGEVFVAPDLRSQSGLLPPPALQTPGEDSHENAWQRTDLIENAWGVIKSSQLLGRARWIWLSITPLQEKPDAGWTERIRWNRMLRGID
jgi:signal peptidase I